MKAMQSFFVMKSVRGIDFLIGIAFTFIYIDRCVLSRSLNVKLCGNMILWDAKVTKHHHILKHEIRLSDTEYSTLPERWIWHQCSFLKKEDFKLSSRVEKKCDIALL